MTFMPTDYLHGRQLIAQFILEKRRSGSFLRYSEYEYIDHWLELADENTLLLTLEHILTELYSKERKGHPPSLRVIHKKVCLKLSQLKQRAAKKTLEELYET